MIVQYTYLTERTNTMNRTEKTTAAILALLMLVMSLAACVNPQDPEITTDGTPAVSTDTPETTSEFVNDDLPDSLKLNDTVTFLYWKDVERPEFFVEESQDDGNIVNTRISERNKIVESRLDVKLEWDGVNGNFGNQKGFVEAAGNSIAAGGGYDVFAGYSMTAATLAMNGYSRNLLELKHLNFEKPWWPQSLTDTATINGKLYFTSGDISTNMLYMMYATFFNKDILTDQHSDMTLSDMYKLVTDGRWTIDKMIELCDGVYRDENANGVADYEDLYGFETIDLHFDAFFIGSDLGVLDKTTDGELVISPDLKSEKTITLLEKITNFFYTSGYAFTKGTTAKYSSAAFKSGRVLYTVDRVYIASGTLRDVSDFKYGILPVPKYNEEQNGYKTCMAFPFTLYSVSVKAKDADAAAAVLECLGSESYRRITPALFEQSMKVRYSESPDDSMMYDLVKKSIVMDLARIFTTPLNNNSYAPFRNAVKDNTAAGWSRNMSQLTPVLNGCLKKINAAMAGQ